MSDQEAGGRVPEVPTAEPAPSQIPTAETMPSPVPAISPVVTAASAPGRVPGRRRVGKVRKPWGVYGLMIITVGIYFLYWWYKANEEIREYDERIQVQPGIAVLATFFPISSIVTVVKTGGRIGQAQRYAGIEARCSGGMGFLFSILFFTHVVYYQSQLNAIWEEHGNQQPGTPV